jgi:hypothetical protein
MIGNYAMYIKRDRPGVCIEHLNRQWQVKDMSCKGKNACFAYVAGRCALEDCASRQWTLSNGQIASEMTVKTIAMVDAENARAYAEETAAAKAKAAPEANAADVIKAAAEVKAAANDGKTALDTALDEGHSAVVAIFRDYA